MKHVALIHKLELLVVHEIKSNQYSLPSTNILPSKKSLEDWFRTETGLAIKIDKELWSDVYHATEYTGLLKNTNPNMVYEWLALYDVPLVDFQPKSMQAKLDKQFVTRVPWQKIVRDKMPEYIASTGKPSKWHVAGDEEYWVGLKNKLKEEVDEFYKLETMGELADIEELLHAIRQFKKFSKKDIEVIRQEKKRKKGAYKKRIYLEWS